jgi:hypothetical protein
MRRLQHLAGIEGMEIRIVVAEPVSGRLQNAGDRVGVDDWVRSREISKMLLKHLGGVGEQRGNRVAENGNLAGLSRLAAVKRPLK